MNGKVQNNNQMNRERAPVGSGWKLCARIKRTIMNVEESFYRGIQANVIEILGGIIKVCRQLTKLNTHTFIIPRAIFSWSPPVLLCRSSHSLSRRSCARIIIYGVFAWSVCLIR